MFYIYYIIYFSIIISIFIFVFIDKEDNNSSYIKIILYALSYMSLFNDFIINEWNINVEENYNNNSNNNKVEQILLLIREILI